MSGRSGDVIDLGITGISDATEIGAGGFGVVYRAIEADLGRTVAVKVLSGNLDEGARYRFERERRAMGRLSGHPNIVTIYRGGYTAAGNAYLVMEFLARGAMADRIRSGDPLTWREVLKFGVQLSGALETSHRSGVLHRDIKPGNILLSSLGNAKLCDFGIARLQGAPETRSSVVTASLAHAPPDVVNGQRPDARSDVYSLASTMFELVTGMPPFVRATDESMVPILARIAQDPVPQLPAEQLPGPVAAAIAKAMAKDPNERPATALDFGELLVEAQHLLGISPTPIPIETVPPDADGSGPSHIPFPDTPSGPLPPPTSPDVAGPPDLTPGGSTIPPANSSPLGSPPGPNLNSDSWAPPTVDPNSSDSAGLTVVHDERDGTPLPPWLIPVAVASVAVLGLLGFLLFSGGDGEGDSGTITSDVAQTSAGDTTPDTDGSPSTTIDLATLPTFPSEAEDDYPTYLRLNDQSGGITLSVPTEWGDVNFGPGQNGPLLAAAEVLEGGFFDSYEKPGVSVELRRTVAEEPETVLDSIIDPACRADGRAPIAVPYRGMLEQFSLCGDADAELFHIVFVDRFQNLTAVMRIQILSLRDRVAANTIIGSLVIDDNP